MGLLGLQICLAPKLQTVFSLSCYSKSFCKMAGTFASHGHALPNVLCRVWLLKEQGTAGKTV